MDDGIYADSQEIYGVKRISFCRLHRDSSLHRVVFAITVRFPSINPAFFLQELGALLTVFMRTLSGQCLSLKLSTVVSAITNNESQSIYVFTWTSVQSLIRNPSPQHGIILWVLWRGAEVCSEYPVYFAHSTLVDYTTRPFREECSDA